MNMFIVKLSAIVVAALFGLAAAGFHWFFHLGNGIRFSSHWLGIVIGVGGFIIMAWAGDTFKRRNIAIMPTADPTRLTNAGPYCFTRNPMYLGTLLMLLGLSIYIGTIPFYVSSAVYFAVLNLTYCRYEENKLMTAFGPEYAGYRARVRRWL